MNFTSLLFPCCFPHMHWGEVKYEKTDAEKALSAAGTAFALLTVMDNEKAAEVDRKTRALLA